MDISSIDVFGCGGPFGIANPVYRITLRDSPSGTPSFSGPVLDQVDITGVVGPDQRTFNWTNHVVALDAIGSTNGQVTVVWDLIQSGYAAFDNLIITASDTPGDIGGDADSDDDGVDDDNDLCPDTVMPEENVPSVRLGTNRWKLEAGGTFVTALPSGNGPNLSYTIEDTHGCSCEQIIDALDLGKGHRKFGCSISVMDAGVVGVPTLPKRGVGAEAVEVQAEVPEVYMLEAAYPNPFNPETTIRFSVPEASVVKLVVYDVLGREVRVLVDGVREAGTHEVVFDASTLPSGTYLVRLVTPEGSFVQTMQLVK